MPINIEQQIRFLSIEPVHEANKAEHLQAFDYIAKHGKPIDARYLLPHVLSEKPDIAEKAASVIRLLLTKHDTQTPWTNLYSFFAYATDHGTFQKKHLKKFARFAQKEAVHLYGIASLNHNGHIREAALSYLQKLPSSEALPYILLRLSDWVPEVRTEAESALKAVFPIISVQDCLRYKDQIEWLTQTKRVDLAETQERFFAYLRQPSNRTEILELIKHANYQERLFCWQALARVLPTDSALIQRAITDSAPEIRQLLVKHLPFQQKFHQYFQKMLSDSAVRVRYSAIKSIPKDQFTKYKEIFETMLFDDSHAIRAYAQFMLRNNGENQLAERYRHKLACVQEIQSGILAGLAETGSKNDIQKILPFVDHQTAKIRAAALSGLHRLDAENVAHLYLQGLRGENTKIRNLCVTILQSNHGHLRTECEEVFKNGTIKNQKAALKVMTCYGALESLRDILLALSSPHSALKELAWRLFGSWHRQYATRLWFCYDDAVLDEALDLLQQLQETSITPPYFYRQAWNDLPKTLQILEK